MKYILSFMIFFAAATASISAYANNAVAVGDTIPAITQIHDQDGKPQSFDSLKDDKGLVLVFVRSLEWCPYCQKQALSINSYRSDFQDAGYNVAIVSYDTTEKTKLFDNRHDIEIPLLSDLNSELIRAFGILDTTQSEGSRTYGIPQPTIFVVNADGVVTSRLAEEGYKNRPGIEDVLAALK